jgi:hypothetical protein
MTNVFSSVFSCLVIELKGKWSIRQRRRFHSTPSILSTLCRYSAISPQWYNLHSYIFLEKGENLPRAHISLTKYPFLAIHAKGGESISPKQKDRTTTPISKKIFQNKFKFLNVFSIGIFEISILLRNSISIGKTLLNTKRRISLRGSFV